MQKRIRAREIWWFFRSCVGRCRMFNFCLKLTEQAILLRRFTFLWKEPLFLAGYLRYACAESRTAICTATQYFQRFNRQSLPIEIKSKAGHS
jgi:hypothetical protein